VQISFFRKKELGNSIIFISIGAFFLILSRGMEADVYIIGPGFLPGLISASLIVINIVRFLVIIMSSDGMTADVISNYRPIYILTILLISYLAGIIIVGLSLATILFIYILMSILGNRSLFQKILIALAVTFAIKAIFKWVLVLPLPTGFWNIF